MGGKYIMENKSIIEYYRDERHEEIIDGFDFFGSSRVEYFGTSRIEAVEERVRAIEESEREISFSFEVKSFSDTDIDAEEIIDELENEEEEEIRFLEEGTLRYGME